jgi:CHAD domain-containing protein
LPRLARKFFRAGDAVVADELCGAELHDFRIQAKRFRYVLEYFRPCYGAAMDNYLEEVRNIQSALGSLNDCCSSRGLLQQLLGAGDPPARYKKLLTALERRESDLTEAFRAHWRDRVESSSYRQRFLRYLAHPPRSQSDKPAAEPEQNEL